MVKWLLLFLLLVNIALFAWLYRPAPPAQGAPAQDVVADTGVAPLVLLSEADHPPAAAPGAASAPAASGTDLACFTVGPFDERALAARVRKRLQEAGLDTRPRVDESRQRDAFWVLIPPLPSRSAADRAIAGLRRKGVEDYFLVSAGEEKNGISLGVFSERSRAQAHLRDMRGRGIDAVLQSVQLPDRKLWLDGASPAPRTEAGHAAAAPILQQLAPDADWQPRACPGGA